MKSKVESNLIRREKLESFIRGTKGHIFTVDFMKRDGSERVLNGRIGVKKGVKGTGNYLTRHPERYQYMTVYDIQKHEFRTINLATVCTVKSGGKVYTVRG